MQWRGGVSAIEEYGRSSARRWRRALAHYAETVRYPRRPATEELPAAPAAPVVVQAADPAAAVPEASGRWPDTVVTVLARILVAADFMLNGGRKK